MSKILLQWKGCKCLEQTAR